MIENKKYYIRKANGGYNPCILGNEKYRDKELNVLPNCVGFAVGRFNEMGNEGSCKYLGNTNAENFTNFCKKQGLELGQTPKKGACMVWEGKGDAAGHTAIVEEVLSDTKVKTSESGWSAKKSYWTQERKKGSGNWGQNSNYSFKGFIYNPDVKEEPKEDLVKELQKVLNEQYNCGLVVDGLFGSLTTKASDKNYLYKGKKAPKHIKWLQTRLVAFGYDIGKYGIDSSFGSDTLSAVKKFQKDHGLFADGKVGKNTHKKLVNL